MTRMRAVRGLKLYGDFNPRMVPRLHIVYLFESSISFGVEFGTAGVDPLVGLVAEINMADLPPRVAELLNRVLP